MKSLCIKRTWDVSHARFGHRNKIPRNCSFPCFYVALLSSTSHSEILLFNSFHPIIFPNYNFHIQIKQLCKLINSITTLFRSCKIYNKLILYFVRVRYCSHNYHNRSLNCTLQVLHLPPTRKALN